jgi:periplasmic copper chaperone A
MQSGVSVNYYNKFFACAWLCVLAGHGAAQVQVENARIQLAPPATTVNAAYMTIHNPQLRAQTIVGVSADCCAGAMLHKTRREGDKVVMDHLEYLAIPAQASVQLAPGGLHIMLTEAQEELTLESKVKITFSFGDGSTQEFDLDVKQSEP